MMMDSFPYGGEPTRNDSVAVSTTSLLISPAHPRKEIVITNTGAVNVSISFGTATPYGYSILLPPLSVYYATRSESMNVSSENIYAISTGAGTTIAIFER